MRGEKAHHCSQLLVADQPSSIRRQRANHDEHIGFPNCCFHVHSSLAHVRSFALGNENLHSESFRQRPDFLAQRTVADDRHFGSIDGTRKRLPQHPIRRLFAPFSRSNERVVLEQLPSQGKDQGKDMFGHRNSPVPDIAHVHTEFLASRDVDGVESGCAHGDELQFRARQESLPGDGRAVDDGHGSPVFSQARCDEVGRSRGELDPFVRDARRAESLESGRRVSGAARADRSRRLGIIFTLFGLQNGREKRWLEARLGRSS